MKPETFEESKRVSTSRGFIGYKNVWHGHGKYYPRRPKEGDIHFNVVIGDTWILKTGKWVII